MQYVILKKMVGMEGNGYSSAGQKLMVIIISLNMLEKEQNYKILTKR